MGFPAISTLNHTPFFHNAIQQKKVASGVFAFYLGESGSELHLGGTSPQHYHGSIEYHPILDAVIQNRNVPAFWVLGGGELDVNGMNVVSPIITIIDSGTSFMFGPPDEVEKVFAQVPGSQALTGGLQGFHSFPCNNVPKISFKWGSGKAWTISEA